MESARPDGDDPNDKYLYCQVNGEYVDDPAIIRVHKANMTKDWTILICSVIRLVYFSYVLRCVCRTSRGNFWQRPAFMNWLPIMTIVASVTAFVSGLFITYWTMHDGGMVIC